jgi:hypothetical protein
MVIDIFSHHSTERVEEMIAKAYRTTESLGMTPSPQSLALWVSLLS